MRLHRRRSLLGFNQQATKNKYSSQSHSHTTRICFFYFRLWHSNAPHIHPGSIGKGRLILLIVYVPCSHLFLPQFPACITSTPVELTKRRFVTWIRDSQASLQILTTQPSPTAQRQTCTLYLANVYIFFSSLFLPLLSSFRDGSSTTCNRIRQILREYRSALIQTCDYQTTATATVNASGAFYARAQPHEKRID